MNLWAKRAGLLFSAAVLIFLISCEDDSYLLGFKGKTKFKGRYQELVFDGTKSSVVLLDSVYTDQFRMFANPSPASYRYLIGEYLDPDFGPVRAEVFASYLPNDGFPPTVFKAPAQGFDSVTVQLLFDYYAYGPETNIDEQFTVYELNDSLDFSIRYFNTSTVPYTGTPLGVLSLKKLSKGKLKPITLTPLFYAEQLDRAPANRDTLVFQGKLEDDGLAYAQRLFNYLNTEGDSALIGKYLAKFRKAFPGFAFIPNDAENVIGINVLSTMTKLSLHYHTAETDSLVTSFLFTPSAYVYADGFHNITNQRTGALAGIGTGPRTRYYPNGNPGSDERYIQDGSVVVTELDLSDFYNFVDTLDNVIIQSAELSAEVKSWPTGMNPIPSLYVMLMKTISPNSLSALNMVVDNDSLTWRKYQRHIFTDYDNFAVASEYSNEAPLELRYDNSKKRYFGYATLFFQALYDAKEEAEYRIEHLGLYPATAPRSISVLGTISTIPVLNTGVGNSVTRSILKTSGIKLKLYYTVPNKPNLE